VESEDQLELPAESEDQLELPTVLPGAQTADAAAPAADERADVVLLKFLIPPSRRLPELGEAGRSKGGAPAQGRSRGPGSSARQTTAVQ
jgi:hypothetical protein